MFAYQVELTAPECLRASRAMLNRRRYGPLLQYLWVMAPVVVIPALAINGAPIWVLALCAGGFVAVGLVAGAAQLWRRRRLAQAYRTTPGLTEPQVYEFLEDALRTSNSVQQNRFAWNAFVEVAETDEFFLFYRTRRFAIYLPKRVVGDATAQETLRAFLRAHIPDEPLFIDLPPVATPPEPTVAA